MRIVWDEDRWAEVRALWADGLSNREICRRWGICETALSAAAAKAGIATPRRPSWWTQERISTLRSMREAGALWREIGARIGCAESAARNYGVEQLGLPSGKPHAEAARLRAEEARAARPDQRPPFPPGHPLTWNLLLALTPSLIGTPQAEYTGRRRIEVTWGDEEPQERVASASTASDVSAHREGLENPLAAEKPGTAGEWRMAA